MTLTHADMAADGPSRDPGEQAASGSGAAGARLASAQRRVFTSAYKLQIVEEYDGLTEFGARGALLRREGLYQSHIEKWRKARDAGRLTRPGWAATPAVSGAERPDSASKAILSENRKLKEENERLAAELEKTLAVAQILGKGAPRTFGAMAA